MIIECIKISKLHKTLNHNLHIFNTLISINLQNKLSTRFQVSGSQPNENL